MPATHTRSGILPACIAVLTVLAVCPRARADAGEPTAAQPALAEQQLTVTAANGARHAFTVELARTPREQEIGLMFRRNLPPGHGMLFVWPQPQQAAMWMKNCPVPEDMVFVGTDDRIISIAEYTVPFSLVEISSRGLAKATLELPGGETSRLGISVGDLITAKQLDRAGPR